MLPPERYTASGGFGAQIGDQVDPAMVLREFAGGATIVLQGLHRTWPALQVFTRRLVDDLGHPAQVNAYITPESARGFDPHYDVHDVFVLQIAGEKHWSVHAPVLDHPRADEPWSVHRAAVEARAREEPVLGMVMRPGDAFYLPRGWLHSATARRGTSIHLTIGIAAFTGADVVRELVSALAGTPALRAPLPITGSAAAREELDAAVREVTAAFTGALDAYSSGPARRVSPVPCAGTCGAWCGLSRSRRWLPSTRPPDYPPKRWYGCAMDLMRGSLSTRLACTWLRRARACGFPRSVRRPSGPSLTVSRCTPGRCRDWTKRTAWWSPAGCSAQRYW